MTKKTGIINKKIGIFLMACGAILVILSVSLAIFNYVEDRNAGKSSQEILEQMQTAEGTSSIMIDGYEYIGYLSIPSLELNLPVMSEWDYDRLKIAPCLFYGSAEDNNMVIAAHNYSRHFGRLTQLEYGDTVTFTDLSGRIYDYTVKDFETLGPLDTEKMILSDWDLTLYTCTYSGANRITVRCDSTDHP